MLHNSLNYFLGYKMLTAQDLINSRNLSRTIINTRSTTPSWGVVVFHLVNFFALKGTLNLDSVKLPYQTMQEHHHQRQLALLHVCETCLDLIHHRQ